MCDNEEIPAELADLKIFFVYCFLLFGGVYIANSMRLNVY